MKNIPTSTEDIAIDGTCFECMGKSYECDLAIELDKVLIIDEANKSHKDDFERLYDKDSLTPVKVRVFEVDGVPFFGMVLYTISYKEGNSQRMCCGGYYPIYRMSHRNALLPHPCQNSICW